MGSIFDANGRSADFYLLPACGLHRTRNLPEGFTFVKSQKKAPGLEGPNFASSEKQKLLERYVDLDRLGRREVVGRVVGQGQALEVR
jgi:hypothetical protein